MMNGIIRIIATALLIIIIAPLAIMELLLVGVPEWLATGDHYEIRMGRVYDHIGKKLWKERW